MAERHAPYRRADPEALPRLAWPPAPHAGRVMSKSVSVRAGADGFVQPPGLPEVEDSPLGRWVCVPGLEQSFQFFRVRVTVDSVDRELVVLPATNRPSSDEEVATSERALAAFFGSAARVFMREDREGWCRVSCPPDVSGEHAA